MHQLIQQLVHNTSLELFFFSVFTFHTLYNTTITCNTLTLNSSQPAYLRSLLSYHIRKRYMCSSNTNLLSVPRVHTTFASMVSVWLPPQYGTHSLLVFALVRRHIHSVVFLKPTVSIRISVPPSSSHKCLRFGPWSTLCTIKYFIYIHTYLLTYS